MKILMLFFSLLCNLMAFEDEKEVNIKSVYEISEKKEYQYGDYAIIERDNKVEIHYNGERLELINLVYYYKVLYNDDVFVFFYKQEKNDYISIIKYEKGKQLNKKTVDNKFINKFDVYYYKNNYLFVSTIEEYQNEIIKYEYTLKDYLLKQNGIVLLLDSKFNIINCKIYGGEENDCFENLYFDEYDEIFYITGKKDQNSGYDFGNGGNGVTGYILLMIDEMLEVTKYVVFEHDIKNISIKNKLYIFCDFDLYILNFDLNVISTLKFRGECIFGTLMSKSWVVVFTQRELEIYDYNENRYLGKYQYEFMDTVDEVKILNDCVYLEEKNTLVKAIFYNDLISNEIYIYDDVSLSNLNQSIEGIPNDYLLKNVYYENGYDKLVFGEYDMFFDYDAFVIASRILISHRCNVTDGYIYPTNYNLFFSGQAFLNGEEIYNNHLLVEEGDYELKLIGKECEKVINFKVFDMDISFSEEHLKNWDYEVRINQELQIDLGYNEDINVKDVIVNGNSHNFVNDVENKKISLIITSNKVESYLYTIDEIIYEYKDKEYVKKVDYHFKVRVLNEKVNINNSFYNDNEYFIFDCLVNDGLRQVRAIKVESENYYQYIPVREGNIIIDNKDLEQFDFYIVYDVGGKLYEEQILFSISCDLEENGNIGEMELVFESDILQEIKIKIKNDRKVKEIIIDDNLEYSGNQSKDYYIVIYCLIFVLFLFVIRMIIRKIKR